MASCDIQIVNPNVLERIESFMADASYREAIENSSNYNTRLCVERRLRMPFLDSQTGVAQNHSNLFMVARERIPGLDYGQVYTYPSKRWRKKRRQYLMQPQVGLRRCEVSSDSGDLHTISTVENPAAMSEDSKDSAGLKDDAKSSDAWYYDEFELPMEGFDDQDPDSDYDYEETYSKRKRKGRGGKTPGRGSSAPSDSPHPKKGKGRGRKKGINYAETGDSEKPFSCDRPPAKRGRPSAASQQQQRQQEQQRQEQQRQQEQFEDAPTPATSQALKDKPPDNLPEQVLIMEQNEKPRATPSPYCDFCLGDAVSNKKSGQPEELVSCSDCGRSGHPTCLLFTKNMIVSVRKYRWQCIECKCCSICGTSDNDDQLLFCDDCDRGYHMYCLVPPLQTPPEGSWSCRSCIRDFH